MPLRKSAGNMYSFVTHTWNPIKGRCYHDCSYCYMKQWRPGELRLDGQELVTDLGEGNFIFVGSGTDIFSKEVPSDWISVVTKHARLFKNKYLWQTKNPCRLVNVFPADSIFCITLESNRHYPEIMNNAPAPRERVDAFKKLIAPRMVTIEPILDFDMPQLLDMIDEIAPQQINIGADSKGHGLPEPPKEKVDDLIWMLRYCGYLLTLKSNLKRLTGGAQ